MSVERKLLHFMIVSRWRDLYLRQITGPDWLQDHERRRRILLRQTKARSMKKSYLTSVTRVLEVESSRTCVSWIKKSSSSWKKKIPRTLWRYKREMKRSLTYNLSVSSFYYRQIDVYLARPTFEHTSCSTICGYSVSASSDSYRIIGLTLSSRWRSEDVFSKCPRIENEFLYHFWAQGQTAHSLQVFWGRIATKTSSMLQSSSYFVSSCPPPSVYADPL